MMELLRAVNEHMAGIKEQLLEANKNLRAILERMDKTFDVYEDHG